LQHGLTNCRSGGKLTTPELNTKLHIVENPLLIRSDLNKYELNKYKTKELERQTP